VLLAGKVLVGFLRGLLTNLDTPPIASDIRSILVRPHWQTALGPRPVDQTGEPQSLLFVIAAAGQASSGRCLSDCMKRLPAIRTEYRKEGRITAGKLDWMQIPSQGPLTQTLLPLFRGSPSCQAAIRVFWRQPP
jgi:hypothetical protein